MELKYSETYLYKLHRLSNALDKLFEQTLQRYAGISLSQFKVLLAVGQLGLVSQRKIATFLEFSPAAISRQVEIAHGKGWLEIQSVEHDRRSQSLQLTSAGRARINRGIAALERHAFKIFADGEQRRDLMEHVDGLLAGIKEATREQADAN